MADEVIFCPACNHRLRVPNNLLGQPVQCPQCRAYFTAPLPQGATPSPPVVPSAYPVAPAPVAGGRGALIGPGIGLLALGGLNVLLNLYMLVVFLFLPEQAEQQIAQMTALFGMPAVDAKQLRLMEAAMFGLFLILSFVQSLGGLAMLLGRWRALAMTGSVLGMMNLPNLCCLASTPFSIWGLIVLAQPGSRANFAGRTPNSPSYP